MFVCSIIAGIISIVSLFTLFGRAYIFQDTTTPSMFQLMLGGTYESSGYRTKVQPNGFLTILFGIALLVIALAVINIIIANKVRNMAYKEVTLLPVSSMLFILSGISSVVSFSMKSLVSGYYMEKFVIGEGAVLFGLAQAAVAILSIVVIVMVVDTQRVGRNSGVSSAKPEVDRSAAFSKPQPAVSEMDKADLIIKYKKLLDDGVITEEEFNKKKSDLL